MNRRDFLTLSATGIIGLGASSFPLPLFAKGSGGKSYSMIILGDTHFDADPPSIYHAHYNEPRYSAASLPATGRCGRTVAPASSGGQQG